MSYPADSLPERDRRNLEMGIELGKLGLGYGSGCDLVAIARLLHRSFERDCDEGRTETRKLRQEKLEASAREILEALGPGWRLYVQSDPRGAPLYICGPEVPEPLDVHYDRGTAVS